MAAVDALHVDVWREVVGWLRPDDLGRLALVSRRMNATLGAMHWRTVCYERRRRIRDQLFTSLYEQGRCQFTLSHGKQHLRITFDQTVWTNDQTRVQVHCTGIRRLAARLFHAILGVVVRRTEEWTDVPPPLPSSSKPSCQMCFMAKTYLHRRRFHHDGIASTLWLSIDACNFWFNPDAPPSWLMHWECPCRNNHAFEHSLASDALWAVARMIVTQARLGDPIFVDDGNKLQWATQQ